VSAQCFVFMRMHLNLTLISDIWSYRPGFHTSRYIAVGGGYIDVTDHDELV